MHRALLLSNKRCLSLMVLLVCAPAFGQGAAKNLFTAKTAYLKVESYRNSNVPAKDLAVVRSRAVSALEGFHRYTLVQTAEEADLVFEAAFASDYVYGKFRSESAPTVFLRVLNRATGAELYCAFGHSGFLTSATKNTFAELRHKIETHDPSLDQPSSMCDGKFLPAGSAEPVARRSRSAGYRELGSVCHPQTTMKGETGGSRGVTKSRGVRPIE
jgi:hypothetical protein